MARADRQLESACRTEAGLVLLWRTGERSDPIPWLWLRDHCPCPECLHPQTRQRLVDTFALPRDLSPDRISLADGGCAVDISWRPDGHRSRYTVALLTAADDDSRQPLLWDAAISGDLPRVRFDDVMADDDALLDWLTKIERLGFCLVAGTPATPPDTRRLAERIGYIRRTIFGDFWEFTADLSHGDTAYTNMELQPHTDGTYSHDAPGLQFLHCLHFSGTGGESVLVDGFRAADRLRSDAPDAFCTLATVPVSCQYLEPGVHLKEMRPVFRLDHRGTLVQVSFNNSDRAPFRLPENRTSDFYAALHAFFDLVMKPEAQLRFMLVPGEVLVFDNWRLLHGRSAFQGERHVAGCYLNHEDFESRLRVLRS